MTSSDRRWDEIAGLLAAGLLRLRAREQLHCSSPKNVELDFAGDRSVCPTVFTEGDGTCDGE